MFIRINLINDTIVNWSLFPIVSNEFGTVFTLSDGVPADFSLDLYDYIPTVAGVYNAANFRLKSIVPQINFEKRQQNIQRMNEYMLSFVGNGLTQPNFDLFLSDTSTFVQQYLGGGGRLITWIETVNRNGYNATTVGFKTRTAYRGATSNGVEGVNGNYVRANTILGFLNDL
jgi:hypothetical protein